MVPRGQSEQPETQTEPGSSKRYRNFYSALQLATQSIASKWTYEDLRECFPSYCNEYPVKAQALRSYLSENIFGVTKDQCDRLLANHNAAAATDVLHAIILEARAQKGVRQDIVSKDTWTPDLSPQSAIHARTILVLEAEKNRMMAELEKLATENEKLIVELETNERQQQRHDDDVAKRLDLVDDMVATFECLPLQGMEQWGMDAEESLGSRV